MAIRSFAALAGACCALGAQAQGTHPSEEITRRIAAAVDHYATSIGCQHADVTAKDMSAPAPRAANASADYVVIWDGDIGCQGHAGNVSSNIAIGSPAADGTLAVVAARSSPHVAFPLPLAYEHRIIGRTADTLTLEGTFLGDGDALCCPSDRRRYTFRRDERGGWTIVDQRELDPKK